MKEIMKNLKLYSKEYISILIIIFIILLTILIFYIFGVFDSDSQKIKKIIIKQDRLSQQEIKKTVGDIKAINEQIRLLNRDKDLLNKCLEYNKNRMGTVSLYQECNINKLLIDYKSVAIKRKNNKNKKTNKTNKSNKSNKFLKDIMNLPGCRITQDEETHMEIGGHVYATDIACIRGKPFNIKASNHKDYYVVSAIGRDKIVGDFIVLKHGNRKYLYGHTKSGLSVGDRVSSGDTIGITTISGVTTGYHLHFEYWLNGNNVNRKDIVNPYNYKLKVQRGLIKKEDKEINIAVTTYDLGDVNQNDSTPCIGASGKDLCKLARQGIQTIALVKPIRHRLGIKFGDKIRLRNIKTGSDTIVQVEDEMNKRFRNSCIRGIQGLCIRADIARYKGKTKLKSGAYKIVL